MCSSSLHKYLNIVGRVVRLQRLRVFLAEYWAHTYTDSFLLPARFTDVLEKLAIAAIERSYFAHLVVA